MQDVSLSFRIFFFFNIFKTFTMGITMLTSPMFRHLTKSLNAGGVLTRPLVLPPQVVVVGVEQLLPNRPRSPNPPRRTAALPTAWAVRRARRAPAAVRRSPRGWGPEHWCRLRKTGSFRLLPVQETLLRTLTGEGCGKLESKENTFG